MITDTSAPSIATRPSAGAILLAAGVSRRLHPYLSDRPKCMLEFDGLTLVQRHILHLDRLGVPELTIVSGYCADVLREHLGDWNDARGGAMTVSFAHNEQFELGSNLSLRTGLRATKHLHGSQAGDLIIMDADVLYHPELLERLVRGAGSLFLLDETSQETGEEMMLGARHGAVHRVARSVADEEWDEVGETVGFFRIAGEHLGELVEHVEAVADEGLVSDEYETALQRWLDAHPSPYRRVGDLAWTEIDFAEDVVKARERILPTVRRAEASLWGSAIAS